MTGLEALYTKFSAIDLRKVYEPFYSRSKTNPQLTLSFRWLHFFQIINSSTLNGFFNTGKNFYGLFMNKATWLEQ
jgi:hypothetical protein